MSFFVMSVRIYLVPCENFYVVFGVYDLCDFVIVGLLHYSYTNCLGCFLWFFVVLSRNCARCDVLVFSLVVLFLL